MIIFAFGGALPYPKVLPIVIQIKCQKETVMQPKNLAREYYGDKKLKERDVRPTKLVDLEGIAIHHNMNIMLYEPKKDRGKDGGSVWQLFYGKIQHKNAMPTINIGLLGSIVFTSKRCMYFASDESVKVVGRDFFFQARCKDNEGNGLIRFL